jgi:hypothetical protein
LINASCKRSNIKKNVLLTGKDRKSLSLNNMLKYKNREEKIKRKEKKR